MCDGEFVSQAIFNDLGNAEVDGHARGEIRAGYFSDYSTGPVHCTTIVLLLVD